MVNKLRIGLQTEGKIKDPLCISSLHPNTVKYIEKKI